ncbi:septum formation inhibitor Maf [Winogradskyella immobilis]|uniref:Septum formation inhibitor Maf n=1 Tax=Winogradskyella immobilis TaxID=2816852 RepID=A0ABS8EN31_9FLAO|nr:septum formation inhibitor Maf [Winogradskyella immobilis]MCC1484267.1 septum formation inhibitor Maf [Winogradskyella immobilis]MCG0016359.1 septum formation inhibitor Maf [Winogradskyella immobilis]
MYRSLKPLVLFVSLIATLLVITSCNNKIENTETPAIAIAEIEAPDLKPAQPLSKAFNDYWYAGEAEITSYELQQARYGEIRNGKAVLVYVTEDFLPEEQVKADTYSKNNTPVLKLNATKNFNTGVYPYSIMQSTFYPVANNAHAIKISASMQEWCGHVYSQLNNREQFEIMSHSYFQGQADENFKIDKAITENQLWNQLRIDPESLPVGDIELIPSLEYIRLKHVKLQSYKANATLDKGVYTLFYPKLNRKLSINFNTNFPHEILGWEETFKDGYGRNAKNLTTKATKLETIKSAYWGKNSNADESLRETLKLQ